MEALLLFLITKIEPQKNDKDRFNIYIDKGRGEEFAFGVDSFVLVKHQLSKGMIIDDLTVEEITHDDSIRKAYNKAVRYLTSKKRTEKEIRSKLADDDYYQHVIDEVVNKLLNQKYIDDSDYAGSYIRTQAKISKIGPTNIKNDLKGLGITSEIIENSLEENYNEETQLINAKFHLNKYEKKYSNLSYRDKKEKIKFALRNKGFSTTIIERLLIDLLNDDSENNSALNYNLNKLLRKYSTLDEKEKKFKIKQGLYKKGFDLSEIETALCELETDD
jgi:regulatory protein